MTTQPLIQVDALAFAYNDGSQALRELSFSVEAGECLGIVGPNGAGKTTLFLCLSGVLPRYSGSIVIDGLNPKKASERKQLPGKVGIVFQNADDQIFNATVFDDVAFGPLNIGLDEAEVRHRVKDALTQVGLEGLEEKVPFHLSGGEKRRVALAGILAMKPSIILFDEPSVHLDPRGRRGLIHLIQGLQQTRIIASHDLELIVETCERCLLLDQGRIVEQGPTRELLANAPLMEVHGLEVPYSLR